MRTRIVAAFELVLLFPAALFMAAVVVRNLNSVQYGLAHTLSRSSCGMQDGCGPCGCCYSLCP